MTNVTANLRKLMTKINKEKDAIQVSLDKIKECHERVHELMTSVEGGLLLIENASNEMKQGVDTISEYL